MLRDNRCALLADPVGSGKTWVALAVAQMWQSREPPIVFAPAAIHAQWKVTAARLNIEIEIWSHERLSRGRIPESLSAPVRRNPSLVILDESHHFRNRATRRYQTLAPALNGRPILMLSATPVVNTLADLGAQLHLGVRDDVLTRFGIPSLTRHVAEVEIASTAMGVLVVVGQEVRNARPARRDHRERIVDHEEETGECCREIERLAFSHAPAIANLVRSVVWRSLASSPLAFLGTLKRYHALLTQAGDARRAGRTVNRVALRRFVGEDMQQLVMWELMDHDNDETDLVLEDLSLLEALLDRARIMAQRTDAKAGRLDHILSDRLPTIVFVGARETVRYLRNHLPQALAWSTGDASGVGPIRLPREIVLSWFRPDAPPGGPQVLVTTDVSAEGLDLQKAGRIVHYDLPWTTVRLDQRDGRAIRMGSSHASVEVIRFDMHPNIESRLAQLGVLARKRRLPHRAGMTGQSARPWLWRARIAAKFGVDEVSSCTARDAAAGWCQVHAPFDGALAGFDIHSVGEDGISKPLASVLGCILENGAWTENPDTVEQWLELAAESSLSDGKGAHDMDGVLLQLAEVVRRRLESARQQQWLRGTLGVSTARLIGSLNQMATRAARARDMLELSRIERAMAFLARGHTAGEEQILGTLAGVSERELLDGMEHFPICEAAAMLSPRLTGLILFTRGI